MSITYYDYLRKRTAMVRRRQAIIELARLSKAQHELVVKLAQMDGRTLDAKNVMKRVANLERDMLELIKQIGHVMPATLGSNTKPAPPTTLNPEAAWPFATSRTK